MLQPTASRIGTSCGRRVRTKSKASSASRMTIVIVQSCGEPIDSIGAARIRSGDTRGLLRHVKTSEVSLTRRGVPGGRPSEDPVEGPY
jgi:hypothetical protein